MSQFQKNKLFKRIGFIIIILLGCFLFKRIVFPSAIETVKYHTSEVTELAENMIQNKTVWQHRYYKVWEITYWENSDMVEFLDTHVIGFLGSYYQGFYYSPKDKPIGFQGVNVELKKKNEKGWEWEGEGDNGGYTEKIMDKWYWFEAHF